MKILLLISSLLSSASYACSCGEWGSATEMLSSSQLAFVGTFASSASGGLSPDSGERLVRTRFNVRRAFKPRSLHKAIVNSEIGDGANCGTEFRRGVTYLVFGYLHEGKIYTDLCSYRAVTSGDRATLTFIRDLEGAAPRIR